MEMRHGDVVEKIEAAIASSGFQGIIATGPDNVQYMGGIALPFAYSNRNRDLVLWWPRDGQPICICPAEWESAARRLGWIERIKVYPGTGIDTRVAAEALADSVRGETAPPTRLGIDMSRMSSDFFNHLRQSLPGVRLVDCDRWLRRLRRKKTASEIARLEDVAYRTDHAILGAVHHLAVNNSHSEKRLAEEVRVHCLERGLDVVGYHAVSQVASGANAQDFWPLAPRFGAGWDKTPRDGELVRVEMRASLDGYWSDAARMATMGEPAAVQAWAYRALVSLREAAVEHLRPGVTCSGLFSIVRETAERQGIEIVKGLGMGHGIGVSSYEEPYLTESDETQLQAGMVLVLDPVIYGPNGEIMRSKDLVVVTNTGCEVLGWYKDWREPYVAAYTF